MSEWIEWNGGECPVGKGTRVDVKLRNGIEGFNKPAGYWNCGHGAGVATAFDWRHNEVDSDIVAYRLHQTKESTLVADGGWIKCSDRMPEGGSEVLCFGLGVDLWIGSYEDGSWDDDDYFYRLEDITHWQPLPAPPKGE